MRSLASISKDEYKSWEENHIVVFDKEHRKVSLETLNTFNDNSPLCIAHSTNSSISGLVYQHWFIMTSNQIQFIEFDSFDFNYENARVNINTRPREKTIVSEFRLTEEVRQRIEHVLGMKNFSMCLRNSEHVANYIYKGEWYSSQVESIIKVFKRPIGKKEKCINKFPSRIKLNVLLEDKKKIYEFISEEEIQLFKPIKLQYYLDKNTSSYNVLMIGPTGSGKSRLINVLFNRDIVESKSSLDLVTKEVYYISANKPNDQILANYNEMILIDTIGLCDQDGDISETIKGRACEDFKSIDVVLVVIQTQRLSSEVEMNIKKLLDWLKYTEYYQRFVFLITKSGDLQKSQKSRLRRELEARFNLKPLNNDFDNVFFTDFPDDEDFTETKQNQIKNEIATLMESIVWQRNCGKIPINIDEDKKCEKTCILS